MKKYQISVSCAILFFGVFAAIAVSRAAELIHVEGNVQVQSPGENEWKKAENGTQVNIGDSIRTARRSKADIALDAERKNTIALGEKTLVVLNSASADTIDRLDLSRGRVYSNMESIKSGLSFEVNTPSAVAGVRGSSYMVYAERDEDEVSAYKDTVFIKAFDADKNQISEIMLPEGFKTFIGRFAAPSALLQVSNREFLRFDTIRDDLISRLEGKQPEMEKAGQEGDIKKTDIEVLSEQSSDQQVIDQVTDTKENTQDSNTQKQIEEIRLEEEDPYGP
jgi:hypothetical protein